MRKTLGIFVAVSALSRHASARAILTYQGLWNTEISQGLAKHHECLSKSYFGAYGQGPTHIFISEFDCLNHVRPSPDDSSEMTIMQDDFLQSPGVLFWLEGAAVADSVRSVGDKTAAQDIMDFIERANTGAGFDYSTEVVPNNGAQMPMKRGSTLQDSNTANSVSLLFAAGSRALVSISPSLIPELDKSLPKYIRPTMLPTSPLPLHNEKTKKAAKHLQSILANLRFNPDIAALTSLISLEKMQKNIRWLTGEDPTSPITSRHSFSPDARVAANWIQKKFEDAGAKCKQKPFLDGFAPNVICRFQGTEETDELVILSGHYDSRGSFGSLRAPGGDDDGSGVTQVLAIAQTISDNEISFRKNVELITFAGEEQGLLGSRAYAAELHRENANITLMIQADMLAYHDPAEPLQLGLPQYIGLPEAAQLVANVSKLYSPELTVGLTAACCSDHQSFHEQGFPATQVFERAGPIIDPMYHNSGDVSERSGYDLGQVRSIAKVTFATLLEVAGFSLPPKE